MEDIFGFWPRLPRDLSIATGLEEEITRYILHLLNSSTFVVQVL